MSEAVVVAGLTKQFGETRALDGVGLTVQRGEMVALLGASGSGKSTLLRHIAGFVAADHGRIDVLGQTVQADGRIQRDVRKQRARIGFVFQQFNLVGRLSVMANVLAGVLHEMPLWRSLLMRFSMPHRQKALQALDVVGIAPYAWQRACTLSGGQQQRAALARCMVQGAAVVLADEPIASLDPESARKVMDVLAQMHRDQHCTVIVCLHQVDYARRYCPRTVALHQGRVVYDGPTDALTPAMLDALYGAQAVELTEPQPSSQNPVHDEAELALPRTAAIAA